MLKFISKNKILILIIALLIILGFGLFLPHTSVSKPVNNLEFVDTIPGEMSVYDFMNKLANDGKISFTEKNYLGMGKFIVSINEVSGNGERNWIYYVNGKKAEIGVSNYKLNQGDVVSWKYEKLNY